VDHRVDAARARKHALEGGRVVEGRLRSIDPGELEQDRLDSVYGPEPTHDQRVGAMLREAAASRGYRLLVAPPGSDSAIAQSVVKHLDGTWLSFADAWFQRHGDGLASWAKAETFPALRKRLTRTAEALLQELLNEHGRPGRTLVVGDTGILGVLEATDLARRLYDETQSGDRGFWVMVVPGTIRDKQPHFNGKTPMWHLPGVTLPLRKVIECR